jgi:hypothetical protein
MGGRVIKIHSAACFQKTEFIFKKFVESVTEIKDQNLILTGFCKFFINSFYGRLALKKTETSTAIIDDAPDIHKTLSERAVVNFLKIGFFWLVEYDPEYSLNAFQNLNKFEKSSASVAYASIITAKARVKLYHLFEEIAINNGRVLYCDTDSVYAAFTKPSTLNFTDTKKNKEIIEDAVFINSKSYAIKYKERTECVFKGFLNLSLDFDILKQNFYSNGNEVTTTPPSLKNKIIPSDECAIIRNNLLKDGYDKRRLSRDKKTTTPFSYYKGFYI